MAIIRRAYVLLVCAVTLQAVMWALIDLLRNLVVAGMTAPVTALAFSIAIIVIGLPLYLVHWLWAQRLAVTSVEERGSVLRRLYMYGIQAALLGPFIAQAFYLIAELLGRVFRQPDGSSSFADRWSPDIIPRSLVAMAILGLFWAYHRHVAMVDARVCPDTDNTAVIRRLYLLIFSAFGLWLFGSGAINLLRWLLFQIGARVDDSRMGLLVDTIAWLAVGLPVWALFWRRAQQLFASSSEEERESAIRKFYLYLVVFVSVLMAVISAAMVLIGVLRQVLGLRPEGDIRDAIATIAGAGAIWAYHALVLREDATHAGEEPRQVAIRRLYLYLVAAIGLAAFLTGLTGNISVLIRLLAGEFTGDTPREELAWFTGILIAGLPVWAMPWRATQGRAVEEGSAGADERRSLVRKIYLYFYLFVATMAALASLVYIAYRLISLALGERNTGNLLVDLGQAVAFSLVAAAVWFYHGAVMRSDGRMEHQEQDQRMAGLRVAVIGATEVRFSQALLEGLRRELPSLHVDAVGLGVPETPTSAATLLSEANLIIAPWSMAFSGELAAAISASKAGKLLVPLPLDGWELVGTGRWNESAAVQQTIQAVRQVAQGEARRSGWLPGGCATAAIIVGVFLLFLVFVPFWISLITNWW